MDSLSSSASTVPSFVDDFAHNMWNPLLELLFLEQVSGIFASFVVEIDFAKVALSCHFALDFLCYKEVLLILHDFSYGTIAPWILFIFLWHHCHLRGIVIFFLRLTPSLQIFAFIVVRRSPVFTWSTYLNDVTQHLLPGPGTTHTCLMVYPAESVWTRDSWWI